MYVPKDNGYLIDKRYLDELKDEMCNHVWTAAAQWKFGVNTGIKKMCIRCDLLK